MYIYIYVYIYMYIYICIHTWYIIPKEELALAVRASGASSFLVGSRWQGFLGVTPSQEASEIVQEFSHPGHRMWHLFKRRLRMPNVGCLGMRFGMFRYASGHVRKNWLLMNLGRASGRYFCRVLMSFAQLNCLQSGTSFRFQFDCDFFLNFWLYVLFFLNVSDTCDCLRY